jgi:hypothetical protein
MKSTIKQQHQDFLDVVSVIPVGDDINIFIEYYDGTPDYENLDYIDSYALIRGNFRKEAFVEFLKNTLAMLESDGELKPKHFAYEDRTGQ